MHKQNLSQFYAEHEQTILGVFWYGLALLIILCLGLANLYYPFDMDQSSALMGAQALGRGEILYVDYWDNKLPGLYYLYYVGGQLFGYNEAGIHLIELIWMLLFAVFMMTTLRPVLANPWLSALAPVATIGVYYAVAGNQLTQLEMLVGFPIYVSVYCAFRVCKNPDRHLALCIASGAAAGIAILFKLILGLMVAAFWLAATVYIAYQGRAWFSTSVRLAIPVVIGASIPVGCTLFYFWHLGALNDLLWTAFVYPSEIFASAPQASKSRLVTASAFFISYFAPWVPFAAIACYRWVSKPSEHVLQGLLLAWIVAGLLVFYAQSFSWWPYHTFIFFVPVGLLAVCGLDACLSYFSRVTNKPWHYSGAISLALLIPICASFTAPFLNRVQPLLSELVMSRGSIDGYHKIMDIQYLYMSESAKLLYAEDALPGPIYCIGHARMYSIGGRDSPHPIAGAFWDFYLAEQKEDIVRTLKQERIPYIFVDKINQSAHRQSPELVILLQEDYDLVQRDAAGIWYRIKIERLENF